MMSASFSWTLWGGLYSKAVWIRRGFMATNKRQNVPSPEAVKAESKRRLVTMFEAAVRAGTLKPVDPNVKPVTIPIRVKST
jgi:hypothetical protein